jgi:hypothetical protein
MPNFCLRGDTPRAIVVEFSPLTVGSVFRKEILPGKTVSESILEAHSRPNRFLIEFFLKKLLKFGHFRKKRRLTAAS